MFSIMIVEDDAIIASALEEELNKWGYDAFQVTDFTDIMDTFLDKKPYPILKIKKSLVFVEMN